MFYVTHQLPNPKNVGSSEYRAIYEVLQEAEDLSVAYAIIDQFEGWAKHLRRILVEEEAKAANTE